MKSLMHATSRALATGVAGVLVAGAATVVAAAPAQAAPATGELQWSISQNFVEHLYYSKFPGPGAMPTTPTGSVSDGAAHVPGDEATGADDLFTFPAASYTESGDSLVVSYTGSVRGAFVVGGTEQYNVNISNPVITMNDSGQSMIQATVWAENIASQGRPAESTEPALVTVAEFAETTSSGDTLLATPKWENVLAAGSPEAIALGITNPAHLTNGKSFHPQFLGALTSGVRAHFHNSSATAAQDHKRPGVVTASASVAPPAATAVLNAERTAVDVAGTNFFGGDANYSGVYVGIAPSGGLPDTSSSAGMAAFAGQEWVMASQVVDGAFNRTVAIETEELQEGVSYSVYTWQAHQHTTDALDTETVIGVLKDVEPVVKAATTTKIKVGKKATRKQAGKATVVVDTRFRAVPGGKVKVTLKIAGVKKAKTVTVTLKKGKATFVLPKAKAKGTYKVSVKYLGNANFKASSKTVSFRVK